MASQDCYISVWRLDYYGGLTVFRCMLCMEMKLCVNLFHGCCLAQWSPYKQLFYHYKTTKSTCLQQQNRCCDPQSDLHSCPFSTAEGEISLASSCSPCFLRTSTVWDTLTTSSYVNFDSSCTSTFCSLGILEKKIWIFICNASQLLRLSGEQLNEKQKSPTLQMSLEFLSFLNATEDGTSSAGSTPLSSVSSNLDLTVLQMDPSAEARDHGREPSEYLKTSCRSIPLVWATTRRRAKRSLSALSIISFPPILTDETGIESKVASFSFGIGSWKEISLVVNLSLPDESCHCFFTLIVGCTEVFFYLLGSRHSWCNVAKFTGARL